MKIAVNVYRRPDTNPIYSRLVVGAALGDASGFSHGLPAWGFAERGIVVVCTPDWESAVSEFLAEGHDGQGTNVPSEDGRTVAPDARPLTARSSRRAREAAA
jgi:hypothetical protein